MKIKSEAGALVAIGVVSFIVFTNALSSEAYNNSLGIRSSPLALMGQARDFVAVKQYDRAI